MGFPPFFCFGQVLGFSIKHGIVILNLFYPDGLFWGELGSLKLFLRVISDKGVIEVNYVGYVFHGMNKCFF